MRAKPTLLLVALLIAISVGGPAVAGIAGDGRATAPGVAAAQNRSVHPPDPPQDRLGWEQGYWYNESIDVDQTDGLSPAELSRYKARTMARLERLRGLEFTADVPIEFISPSEVPARVSHNVSQFRGSAQQWQALFVIGEDRNASQVVFDTLVGNVGGWAAEEGSDSVVLITQDPAEPTAPPRLIAHELVHVLQDQHFDLSAPRYRRRTMDGEHAKDAVVEGEAHYLEQVYRQHCANGSWQCVDHGGSLVTGPGRGERKLLSFLIAPYTLGGQCVHRLIDRGGFDAVRAAQRDPPRYSSVALLANESVAPDSLLSLPDRSDAQWRRRDGFDRVGAMGLQGVIGDTARGWRNGVLYPYTNGSAGAFVWETTWDSARTARTFAATYRDMIQSHGGRRSDGVWRIPDGPFADAYAINRTGRTVRIVNAPTVDSLSGVYAGVGPGDDTTRTVSPRPSVDPTTTPSASSRTSSAGQSSSVSPPPSARSSDTGSGGAPGFGVGGALAALSLFVFVNVRSSR